MNTPELRAQADAAKRDFWQAVNERIHGRVSQDRVREAGQFAEQTQERWLGGGDAAAGHDR
jgi:hypothetical protein